MNLRLVAEAAKRAVKMGVGQFIVPPVAANTGARYIGKNLNKFRETLESINGAPPLQKFYNEAASTTLFKRVGDELDFPREEWVSLNGLARTITDSFPVIAESLLSVAGEETTDTIYFKLPDSNNLGETGKVMEAVEKLLEQIIVHPSIGGQIKLVGCENGSIWLQILVGTPLAVAVVAHLAKSAAIVYRRFLDNKIITAQLEGIEAKSDSLRDIQQGMSKLMDKLIEAESRQLYDQHIRKDAAVENEQIERVKHSIKTLAELMNRGAEIQPGLLLPPEVKVEFPDMKKLLTISSPIKQIVN